MLEKIFALWLAFADARVGIATHFSAHGDAGNPNPMLACAHRPRRNLDDRKDMAVAMRDGHCRSRVLVCLPRTGRCVVARILDRGPFGKTKGKFTALIDLAPRVARKLKHNGFEVALVVPL